MTYRVELTRSAARSLAEELPEPVATACLAFIYGALAENPRGVGKPLRSELSARHSARRGQFRVVYAIHDDRVVVAVIAVAHRRDVYR